MAWYYFVIFAIIAFSINSLLFRSVMKQKNADPFAQMVALFGLSGMYLLVLSIALNALQTPPIQTLGFFLFGAIAALLGSYCINSAYKLIEASEVTILSSSQRLWSVLAAFFFLGEPFSPVKMLATLIIICGVVVASFKHHTLKWDKGALFVLMSAILFATADIAGYYILQQMNTISFTIFSYLLPVFIIIPLRPKTITHLKFYFKPHNAIMILISAALDAFGYFSFNHAYFLSHNASLITPLVGTRVILTVILAALFLDERDNLQKKAIGAGIVILGSSLLFFD